MSIASLLTQIRELIDQLPDNDRSNLARIELAMELAETVDGADEPLAALQVQKEAVEARLAAVAARCKKARQVKWAKANTAQMTTPTYCPKPRPAGAPAPIHHSAAAEMRPYWIKPDGTVSFSRPGEDD